MKKKLKQLLPSIKKKSVFGPKSDPQPDKDQKEKSKKEKKVVDKQVVYTLNRLKYFQSMNPSSPDFLGTNIKYPKKKNRLLSRFKPMPDLDQLRDEVNRFSEQKAVTNPRKKINTHLKKHPYNSDLRALKGVQIFNDVSQSGLDIKRLDALQNSLIEVANAIHNGSMCVNNATWLLKIYIRYLEFLHQRLSSELNSLQSNFHWQVRQANSEMRKILLQVTSMMSVKRHLAGLTMLNAKLKGSAFTYDNISKEEIIEAARVMVKGENKNIGSGKTANYVIWVIITLSSLFARVPMMKKLVQEMMQSIPDISRNLSLQKEMVRTAAAVTEYQLALTEGDQEKITKLSNALYRRCHEIIRKHLNGITNFSKSFEIDPFLKAAWITIDSNGLYEKPTYKQMLEESLDLVNTVIGGADVVRGSFDLAIQLQSEIEETMEENGWSPYG